MVFKVHFTFRKPIYALVVPLDGDSVLARNILELITFHGDFFKNVEPHQLVCLFHLSITGMLERLTITVGTTLLVKLPSCCVTSPS